MKLPMFVRRARAHAGGYFWLPCPICGECFGGHEWLTELHDAASIPIRNEFGKREGVCPSCTYRRKEQMTQHDFNVEERAAWGESLSDRFLRDHGFPT